MFQLLPETPALVIRPIAGDDRAALAAAFDRLSPQSRYRRFLSPKPTLSSRELTYLTEVDHVNHEAVVALDGDGQIVGEARYATWEFDPYVAELAATVVDDWQRQGIGTALAARVIERARANHVRRLTAVTAWDNTPARRLLTRLGFRAIGSGDGVIEFTLPLA